MLHSENMLAKGSLYHQNLPMADAVGCNMWLTAESTSFLNMRPSSLLNLMHLNFHRTVVALTYPRLIPNSSDVATECMKLFRGMRRLGNLTWWINADERFWNYRFTPSL
mmetsp:Transcript_4784/g.9672  ORF Transcript_4784/g.9672 Transcript_4784/m.9672 type:complete len:109 (+) Transcript_4784:596-922(+)